MSPRGYWLLLIAALAVSAPLVAYADDYVGTTTTTATASTTSTTSTVLGVTVTTAGPVVKGIQVVRPEAQVGGLAVTGADIAGLTAIGVALLLSGVVLVRRARNRSPA